MPNDMSPLDVRPLDPPNVAVTVEAHELRALLRIATELRDPRWALEPWIIDLGQKCGLNLRPEVN